MNITPVSLFKVSNYKPLNKAIPFRKKETREDTFVRKSEKPLSEYYSKALADFTKDAEEYIMNAPKVTYRGLRNIIKKYSSRVKITKFKNGNSPNKAAIARFSQDLYYQKTNAGIKEEIKYQIIQVNIPKKQDKASRAELLGSFVHEAVHLFQYETKLNVHGESFIKKYYKNAKTVEEIKEITNAINQLHYGFCKLEHNISILRGNFLDECFIPSYVNLKNFDKFLLTGHDMSFKDISMLLMEDAYYDSGDDISNTLGQDSIMDYVKEKLAQELEAYKAEDEVIQKYCPIVSRKMSSKFSVDVYERLLEIAGKLRRKRTN